MKKVKLQCVDDILEPLVGLADDDKEVLKYANINPNDSDEMKPIIEQIIKPHFEMLDQGSKEVAKDSLRRFLCSPDTDFERTYYSNLIPFDAPDPPKVFFVWLWEVLFEHQSYE